MPTVATRILHAAFVLGAAFACVACGENKAAEAPLLPAETFHWITQPIAFCPPPEPWIREGTAGAGTVGVRFVLRGGGGQCINVEAYRQLAERIPRQQIFDFMQKQESLPRREFLRELSLLRPRAEPPLSDREAAAVRAINQAIDRAQEHYLGGQESFVSSDLRSALHAAENYRPTLEELLPEIRLRPERMQHPEYWRLGVQRDTMLAGLPAFASDDTLVVPEQTLLYRQVFWVVNGCAFKVIFQGRAENLAMFHRVVDSVQFPEPSDAPTR